MSFHNHDFRIHSTFILGCLKREDDAEAAHFVDHFTRFATVLLFLEQSLARESKFLGPKHGHSSVSANYSLPHVRPLME